MLARVEIDFVGQAGAIGSALLCFEARLVPIAHLNSDQHAEDDNREIDRHREPIVVGNMLADSANDQWRAPFDPMLTNMRNCASVNRRETPWPLPIR